MSLRRKLRTTPATDNLPPQDNIYPDRDAAIVGNAGEDLELSDVMRVMLTLQRDISNMSTRIDQLVSTSDLGN